MKKKLNYHIKNMKLAGEGQKRMEWAAKEMPVLQIISQRFAKEKVLKGVRLACCLHVTTETANLMLALKAGGAEIALCASNPLSTQDDVAAALVKNHNISVYSINGEGNKTYYGHIKSVLSIDPHITMDDGADLVSAVHRLPRGRHSNIIGGSEETTTGVIRLRAMERDGVLRYPMIAVNDAMTKHLFDNRYGTGQSTIDGILRATNILLAGKNFVVCGYGYCGRGIAMRAQGMGAKVIVCEVSPLRALEATMDGFAVMSMDDASKVGDIYVTSTGDISVISGRHFQRMKNGAILANSGHFNVEIDIPALKKLSTKVKRVRQFVDEFTLKGGNKIIILGEGRLVNLAAAEGHPASVMDMSFANQSLCAEYLVKMKKRCDSKLENRVYPVPEQIDKEIARMKLKSMNIEIDKLTVQQEKYLTSWTEGT